MADYPPYMNSYGSIEAILGKIREAKTPDRFTQDFLAKGLGLPGGGRKPFIPLAKRLGLLSSDGAPTDLYRAFRNEAQSKVAMAAALRKGYSQLFEKNEQAFKHDKKKLAGLVTEITGLQSGHATVRAIVGTFDALRSHADFESELKDEKSEQPTTKNGDEAGSQQVMGAGVNLSYTLYLNLPNTDDIAVFNAIFRSLKENLLR